MLDVLSTETKNDVRSFSVIRPRDKPPDKRIVVSPRVLSKDPAVLGARRDSSNGRKPCWYAGAIHSRLLAVLFQESPKPISLARSGSEFQPQSELAATRTPLLPESGTPKS